MSIGLARLASRGRMGARVALVFSLGDGSSSPTASQASAAKIPSPPPFVSTATRGPRGSGCLESSTATSASSSSESAWVTPACRNTASTAVIDPASAAVCDPAARWPAPVRPPFIARIGFFRAMRWASRPNLRGLPNDSR